MTGSKSLSAFVVAAALTLGVGPSAAQSPKIVQFTLSNGMQVVVIPDTRAPVVTQMLWFKVGSVDDPPGYSGQAHFFEHMMFRGTKKVPGDLFSQTVSRNGGRDNAFTAQDYTAFFEEIAKDRLKIVMGLEADRMANLDLSDSSVATERDVVIEERRMRTDNDPQALFGEQLNAALYLSHPYGRPVIGWPDEMRRYSRAEAQDFYNHHYAPNNAILVVAGDVTPEQVKADAQEQYGKVAARQLVPRVKHAEPARLGETRLRIVNADATVPLFEREYRVASYVKGTRGQAESLETLAYLLGGDPNSALYRALVVEKKLATQAGAYYNGYTRDSGEFGFYAEPRPGVTPEKLEQAIDQVLAGFVKTPVKAADLERAKTNLVASITYRRDSQFEMASAYGQALTIGLTVDDVNAWPQRMRAVDAKGVQQAAQSLNLREAATGYLVPGKK